MGVDDFTICIPTFGSNDWVQLAQKRAIPSAEAQNVPVIHRHGATLAQARNEALALVRTPWLVCLDADDQLAPGYIEQMAEGTCDLRAPAVSYVRNGRPRPPYVPKVAGHRHDCEADCLRDGNFICIGAAVRTNLLLAAGGFREFPWSEDWDAWVRVWRAGGSVESIPEAVYIAHVRPDSRNRAPDRAFKEKVHWDIHRANFPELYEEAA